MMAIYFSGMALAAFALVASVQAEAFDIPAGASKTLIFATALMMITAWPILFVYVFWEATRARIARRNNG